MGNNEDLMSHRNHRLMFTDEKMVVVAMALLIAGSGWVALAPGSRIEQEILACRLSGYGALGFLAISILLGPVLRTASWIGLSFDGKTSARISKNTGIASAIVAVVHSVIAVADYLQGNWREMFDESYLYAGLLALVILVLLLVFSLKPLMSQVGWELWKPTFRLSFAAAILVLCHLLYAPFASMSWTLSLYGFATAIFLLRFLPSRGKAPAKAVESSGTAP
jgi:DMSO/TMAO reductase YedYZ heme-binding membrane subunit